MMIEQKTHPDALPYLYYGKQLEYRFPLGWYLGLHDTSVHTDAWGDLFTAFPKDEFNVLICTHRSCRRKYMPECVKGGAEQAGVRVTVDICDIIEIPLNEGEYDALYMKYDIIFLEFIGMDIPCLEQAVKYRTLIISTGELFFNPINTGDFYHFDLNSGEHDAPRTPTVIIAAGTIDGGRVLQAPGRPSIRVDAIPVPIFTSAM